MITPLRNGAVLFIAIALTTHADSISFVKHTIDADFENGYQVSVADIDSDGKLDMVALATTPSRLVWYRSPAWDRFDVTTKGVANIDMAPYDVDGDGDFDLALASEFSLGNSSTGGSVYWLECPEEPVTQQEWAMHRIDAVPTSHRVRWADIDGDGRPELINLPIIGVGATAPDYAIPLQFKMYTIPADPKGAWPARVIDESLCMAHGLSVVCWDADQRDDLLTASFDGVHLHRRANGIDTWTKIQLGIGNRGDRPKQGSSEVSLGKLSSIGKRYIGTIEPWHGNEVVVYMAGAESNMPWPRTVIDDTFNDGHALLCTDLDNDGNDEIVAGHRGPAYSLFCYRYASTTNTWERIPIDEGGMSAAGIFAADLENDGDVDIIATGSATKNVVWYENVAQSRTR